MEFTLNIPEWLKIPINILLPAVWLVSGMLLFVPDSILVKLHLSELCLQHGSIIGIVFVVSTALLVVYLCIFLKKFITVSLEKVTRNRRTIRRFSKLNDTEQAILVHLYNSPGYTDEFDLNQPIVQGLLSREYIYTGGFQHVTTSAFSNALLVRVTLQPFVYQAFDYYRPEAQKELQKLEIRIDKQKDQGKKAALIKELTVLRENIDFLYNSGNKDYICSKQE